MIDTHHNTVNQSTGLSVLGILFVLSFSAFLFLSLFPFAPSFTDTFFDRHRVLQVGFICIFLLASLLATRSSQAISFPAHDSYQKVIGLVCLLGFISAIASTEPLNSLFYTLHIALLFFLTLAISRLNPLAIRYSLVAFVILHSTLISYCLLYLVFAVSDGVIIRPEVIYFGFDNIRFFNQVQIFVLPILLLGCQHPRFGSLSTIFFTANLVLMFLGGGLGIALSWVLVLVLFWLYISDKQLLFRAFVLTGLSFAFSFGLQSYLVFLNDVGSAGVSVTSSGRIELWAFALSQFEWLSLLIGSGPGLFEAPMSTGMRLSHPHNSIIELALEWGWIAFLLVMGLVAHTLALVKRLLSAPEVKTFTITHALLLAWIGGLSLSLVSGVIVMPMAQTLLFVFWGFLLIELRRCSKMKHDKVGVLYARYLGSYFARGLAIIVVIGYAYLVFWTYCEIDPFAPAFQGPRFWLNGERYLP